MKKIPTLFEREYENHKVVGITDKVTPGCEIVLEGKTIPTVKWDGSCCAIINGEFYKRYDAKKGKKAPAGAIPCCEPDPVTGHWPHWVKCDPNDPSVKWYVEAWENSLATEDGTYEAVGPHFQGNPYNLLKDTLVRHGSEIITVNLSLEGLREFLSKAPIEGIVFWYEGEPLCKIKRTDFGFEWPIKE